MGRKFAVNLYKQEF